MKLKFNVSVKALSICSMSGFQFDVYASSIEEVIQFIERTKYIKVKEGLYFNSSDISSFSIRAQQ